MEWNWSKHRQIASFIFPKFSNISSFSISTCQSYGGKITSEVYIIKIKSFVFIETDLLISEKCNAILVPASSWFDVKRLRCSDCDINTPSLSIFKVMQFSKSLCVCLCSCERYSVNFISSWDLTGTLDIFKLGHFWPYLASTSSKKSNRFSPIRSFLFF